MSVSNKIKNQEKKLTNGPRDIKRHLLGLFLFALPPCCLPCLPGVLSFHHHSALLYGLVVAWPSPCHFEVAPVPTPQAVARSSGTGCLGGGSVSHGCGFRAAALLEQKEILLLIKNELVTINNKEYSTKDLLAAQMALLPFGLVSVVSFVGRR